MFRGFKKAAPYFLSAVVLVLVLGGGYVLVEGKGRKFDPVEYEHARLDQSAYEDVSIVQLLANSSEFDGKMIRVKGLLAIERHNTAIYLDRESYLAGITENSVYLPDFYRRGREGYARLNERYVVLQGRFSSVAVRDYNRAYLGALREVVRPRALPTRRDQRLFAARERLLGWAARLPAIGTLLVVVVAFVFLWRKWRGSRTHALKP